MQPPLLTRQPDADNGTAPGESHPAHTPTAPAPGTGIAPDAGIAAASTPVPAPAVGDDIGWPQR